MIRIYRSRGGGDLEGGGQEGSVGKIVICITLALELAPGEFGDLE